MRAISTMRGKPRTQIEKKKGKHEGNGYLHQTNQKIRRYRKLIDYYRTVVIRWG